MMVLNIAWRNIWRNRIRSWVVIGSILLAIWSVLFILSFSFAMSIGYVENSIRNQTSHLQLHNAKWVDEKEIKYMLEDAETVLKDIENQSFTEAATIRTVVNGMVRSSRAARGIEIKGVIPEKEATISQIDQKIIEGEYFGTKRNEIIISQKLAEKLKLKLRKKLVLQFQDLAGDIVAGSFRIVGLFNTGNTMYDESFVLVKRRDINRLLDDEDAAHEIALFLKDPTELEQSTDQLNSSHTGLLVQDYRELSPDVRLYETQIEVSSRIFTFIFMLALIFGIINTMLMAVLERNKELGMLMALGMNKTRVFFMIVLETLLLGLIALPLGLLLAWGTISLFGDIGINLTAFADAIEQYGLDTIIYPYLPQDQYVSMASSLIITALLASLYPAYKAIKLRPVEAMRKI